jgi:hypothetical protein
MSKNILMITVATLKQKTGMHDNIEDKLVYPEIKTAQDMFITPMVGSALYNKILADIESKTLAGVYLDLVDNYIADCLCHYVLANLPSALNYQFWNKGVASKTTDQSSQPTMSDMYALMDRHTQRAEWYKNRCIKHLRQNVTQFPEYAKPGQGIDTIIPERTAYNCPIYLGDNKLTIPPNVPEVFNSNDPSYY